MSVTMPRRRANPRAGTATGGLVLVAVLAVAAGAYLSRSRGAGAAPPIGSITSWVYQLQNYDDDRLDALARAPQQLAVILAKLVLRTAGVSPRITTAPAPPGAVARRCPDLSRLRALTGYEPAVPLEEGVRRTFDWYRESWPR